MIKISWKLALASLIKNPWARALAIASTSFILVLGALFLQLRFSFSNTLSSVKASYFITANVQPSLSMEKEEEIRKKIESFEGIKNIKWFGKDEFIENFSKYFPQISKDLQTLDADAIPRYFKLQMQQGDAESLKSELLKIPGIESIELNKNRFENLYSSINLMKNLTGLLLLGSVLTVFSIFINHFRLDPLNRQKLVLTMESLGANRSMVAFPVMIGGIIEGFLSGFIASVLIIITHPVFEKEISRYFSATGFGFNGISIASLVLGILIFGIFAGTVGSFWSSLIVQLRRK